MLQRMRELAVQAANATNSAADRDNLNAEYLELNGEITRQIGATTFNGIAVLSGVTQVFQVGANTTDQITVTAGAVSAAPGGTLAGADGTAATAAITAIDAAMTAVTSSRATFGAVQNRFQSVINNLSIAAENQAAARSRIMDADFAMETANLTRLQIMQQAGTAMVAQANAIPQSVLTLLQ